MPRTRLTLMLFLLAALPLVLAACGKGGGGY
jgi:predicted small secreted protein